MSEISIRVLSAWILLAVGASVPLSAGIYLTVSNSPTVTLSTSDLTSGAGTDLSTTKVASTSQQLNIAIPIYGLGVTWEIDIALSSGSPTWPSNVTVFATRTGNGGNTSISGGTSAIQLTTSPQKFFTGQNNATGVTVQYTIGNLSLANCAPGTNYSYPISYTFGTP